MLAKLMKLLRESFPAKIISLVVASVLITSVVVGLATTRSTGNFLSEKTRDKIPSTLLGTATRLRVWYQDQFANLDELCQSQVFLDDLAEVLNAESAPDSASRAEVKKYLALVHKKFPVYDDLLLLRPDGSVVTTSTGMKPTPAAEVQTRIDEGAMDAQFTGAWATPDGSRTFQWLMVPIRYEGDLRAWVVARVDLVALGRLLRAPDLEPGAEFYLLDRHGRFLTQPRLATQRVLNSTAMQVPTRETGPITVETRNNYQGVRVFHAKTNIEELGWWLVYEEDYKMAMQPVLSAQRRIWVAVLVIVALAILAALRMVQSILRPIRDLYLGAQRINEGLVGVKIPKRSNDEIGEMIETFNEMANKITLSQAELQYKNKVLNQANDELQEANARLAELSVTDGLTGLFNHRHFWNLLNTELTRVNRYQGELGLMLVDLDDFKRVNDQFGHSVGDLLLQSVARILKETVRETDIVARYGGEEFAILLPDTDDSGVRNVSEKLRRHVESLRFKVPDTDIVLRVTVSAGVSVYRGNRREFFNDADKALYESKSKGKNQVQYMLR